MTTVVAAPTFCKSGFDAVAAPFLQGGGLPFTDVLDAEAIQRVFSEEEALFAQDDIFSTDITLWAFLAQTLRDGKGASCAAAVADITTYMLQVGQQPPAGDTGDYCRARAKLSLPAKWYSVDSSRKHCFVYSNPRRTSGAVAALKHSPNSSAWWPARSP